VYQTSLRDPQLAALFAKGTVLVPVPGSTATGDAQWVALQLAIALSQVGFELPVWVGLRREFTVRKSAQARSGLRPSVTQHYESFSVVPMTSPIRRIVLVDDVVTKGRTLLAAAARLRAELPYTDIRAFALLRTHGFVQRLDRLTGSCHGVIRWAAGDARRDP
jgi:predicted amidophosphoribosyltransferase